MQRYQLNANGAERDDVLANVHAFVDRLPKAKSWRIEIKEDRKERTDPQNRALFGVAYPAIRKATGHDVDELHRMMCGRFFGWVNVEILGEVSSRPYRTTTTNAEGERDVMPTADFAAFYEMVQRMGAEAGIDVPAPDPLHGDQRWAA
jgi:hypothetical protein